MTDPGFSGVSPDPGTPGQGETTPDDLLDEATRLADGNVGPRSAVVMRALVARVREAESRAVALSETRTRLLAKHPHVGCDLLREEMQTERDEARARLDDIRAAVTAELACLHHPDDDPVTCGWKTTVRDVLAILERKDHP